MTDVDESVLQVLAAMFRLEKILEATSAEDPIRERAGAALNRAWSLLLRSKRYT